MGPKETSNIQLARDAIASVAVKSNQHLTPDPTLEFRPSQCLLLGISISVFMFRGAVKIRGQAAPACLRIVRDYRRPALAVETLKQDLRHCQSFLADQPRGSCSRCDDFLQAGYPSPKISWEGAPLPSKQTAKHDRANRSFGVVQTWRDLAGDLAGQPALGGARAAKLETGIGSIGAAPGRESWVGRARWADTAGFRGG